MYKIINIGILKYFIDLIWENSFSYILSRLGTYSLDPSIINFNLIEVFKSKLLAFIQPVQRSIYNVFNPQGLKFLTQLHLGLSHLNQHRFRHNFKDCINPLCSCSLEVENTHFFALPTLFNFLHGSYE